MIPAASTSSGSSAGATPGESDRPLRCPLCSTAVAVPRQQGTAAKFTCPRCGAELDVADILRAEEYARAAQQAQDYAQHLRDVASRAAGDAHAAARTAAAWQRAAEEAAQRARRSAAAAAILPQPGTRPATVAPEHRRGVPTALLLQGTGALMILGAAVLVSAVAWTFLPPTGQAALLVGMVAALGAVTIELQPRVPTTSAILAALTAAVAVVVAVGLPAVVAGVNLRPYAAASAVAVTVLLLLAGRFGSVLVWRHLGWASMPVSAAIVVYSALAGWQPADMAWSLAAIVLSAGGVGLLWSARRQRLADAETSETALWAGVAVVATAATAAAVSVGWTAAALADAGAAQRLGSAAAVVALAMALAAAGQALHGSRLPMPEVSPGWAALLPPLGVAIVATPAAAPSATVALALPAVLATELAAGAAMLRVAPRGDTLSASGRAWLLGAAAWTPAWLATTALLLPARGGWFWLNDLLVGMLIGAAGLAWGAYRRQAAAVLLGCAVMLGSWSGTWIARHLGEEPESLTLPLLAIVLVTAAVARGRAVGLGVPAWAGQALAAGLGLPSFLLALSAYADTGQVQWWRLGALVLVLVVATALGWRARGGRTIAAATAAAVVVSFGVVALQLRSVELPEAYVAVFALAAVAVAAVAHSEELIARAAVVAVGAIVLLVPSYALAVYDAGFAEPWAAARAVLLQAALAATAAACHRRYPRAALTAGLAALALAAWWWGWFVADSAAAGVVEAWTLPWAALATAGYALYRAERPRPGSPAWAYTVPAGLVVVLPSYTAALADPQFALDGAVLRGAGLIALAAAATAWTWRHPAVSAVFASAGAALVAWWWGFWVAGSDYAQIVEVWAVPWALLATAVAAMWLRTGATRTTRSVALLVPAAGALTASASAAIATPLGTGGTGDDLRAVAVPTALWLLAVGLRRIPWPAAAAGVAALAMTWWQVVSTIGARYDPGVELYTWTGAAALAAASAWAVRVSGRQVPTWLSVAPAVSLALLPTAILAWSSGQASWRVWFVLSVGAVILVAGVRLRWAGAVYPSLVAIAAVVVPVLTRLAQDLPAYVPLTIVGVALLAVGARLEALRRSGKHLSHWNSLLH